MANWKKVLVSGSAIEVRNITASNIPDRTDQSVEFLTVDSDGRLLKTGSAGGGGGGIFTNQGTSKSTNNSLNITGSTLQAGPDGSKTETKAASFSNNNYAVIVSQSAYFQNHNVGHPNSLAWQSNLAGSIFNDYDASTDVSEILRALVGIISSSNPATVASPTPNTHTFGTFTSTIQNGTQASRGNTTFPEGRIPQGTTDEDVLYTINKDFTDYGEKLLGNITNIYNNENLHWVWSSNEAGSTTVSSDNDPGNTDLIGIGKKTSPGVQIDISISRQWDHDGTSFVFGDVLPVNGGAFSASIHSFNNSTLDSTNEGININVIPTGNPTVIPSVFIDGKATDLKPESGDSFIFCSGSSGDQNVGGHTKTSISSSGWYKQDITYLRIYTGSQTATVNVNQSPTSPTPVFWAPVGQAGIFGTLTSQLSNDVSFGSNQVTSGSFTSRSLSGAPYLNGAEYTFSTSASNAFKPVYTSDASITSENLSNNFTEDSTNGADISAANDFSRSGWTAATQNSLGVITSAGVVYNGGTDQNSSVPNIDSVIHLKKTETLDFGGDFTGGNKTNTRLTTSEATNDTFTATFTVEKITTAGAEDNEDKTFTQRPHLAGHFGQPAASGSMLLFGSADGQDESSQSSTVGQEEFLGEANRRTIGASDTVNNLSNAFDSGSALQRATTTKRDAQVKPGYLVIPGSTYGYWYPTSYYNAANYYWYLREFNFGTPGSPSSLDVTLTGASTTPTLTGLQNDSADSMSVGLIFQSGVGLGDGSRTNVVDLTKGVSANVSTGVSNPFTNNINITGWTGGTAYSGNTANISFAFTTGAPQISNSFPKVWVLVRMRGDAGGSNGLERINLSLNA